MRALIEMEEDGVREDLLDPETTEEDRARAETHLKYAHKNDPMEAK